MLFCSKKLPLLPPPRRGGYGGERGPYNQAHYHDARSEGRGYASHSPHPHHGEGGHHSEDYQRRPEFYQASGHSYPEERCVDYVGAMVSMTSVLPGFSVQS